jgi:hypothetical protein
MREEVGLECELVEVGEWESRDAHAREIRWEEDRRTGIYDVGTEYDSLEGRGWAGWLTVRRIGGSA